MYLPLHLCEFSATSGICQIAEEATVGWSADSLEQALGPGVTGTAPTQDGLLCGGWWPFAHTPPSEGSQAGVFPHGFQAWRS